MAPAQARRLPGRPMSRRAPNAFYGPSGSRSGSRREDCEAQADSRPLVSVKREFTAHRPNAFWVADFNCVASWSGLVYVTFVVAGPGRTSSLWSVQRLNGWAGSATKGCSNRSGDPGRFSTSQVMEEVCDIR